jgi:pyridoxamine 5'-phosphate oxidase
MSDTEANSAATALTGGDSAPDFSAETEPLRLFHEWMEDARQSEPNDPDAMALATVDQDGMPDVRMVLLKAADREGFVFYTNTRSAKGHELETSPRAALVFHWKSLRRQVRVRGPVERVTDREADAYFASRPRGSRIGAWASQQSQPLESCCSVHGPLCHRRDPAPATLDRVPRQAGADRVLARSPFPPSRPGCFPT